MADGQSKDGNYTVQMLRLLLVVVAVAGKSSAGWSLAA